MITVHYNKDELWVIHVASIEGHPTSCVLSVFLEILWLMFVQMGKMKVCNTEKLKL
jgi:hypothetical protein